MFGARSLVAFFLVAALCLAANTAAKPEQPAKVPPNLRSVAAHFIATCKAVSTGECISDESKGKALAAALRMRPFCKALGVAGIETAEGPREAIATSWEQGDVDCDWGTPANPVFVVALTLPPAGQRLPKETCADVFMLNEGVTKCVKIAGGLRYTNRYKSPEGAIDTTYAIHTVRGSVDVHRFEDVGVDGDRHRTPDLALYRALVKGLLG